MDYDLHKHYELKNPKEFYTKKGLSGILTQRSNTCYIVSTLQCLSHTLKLTDEMISNGNLTFNRNKYGDITRSYYNLLNRLWDQNQLVKSKIFIDKIKEHFPQYKHDTQEDAHEFFITMCDIFEKGIGKPVKFTVTGDVNNHCDYLTKKHAESWCEYYKNNYSYFANIFDGTLLNEVKCINCQNIDENFTTYNTLTLPISKVNEPSILDCFNEAFKDETIDDWKCDKCNSDKGCVKSSKIWNMPTNLVIHFSRFKYLGTQIVKDNDNISIKLEMTNFKDYIHQGKKDPNNYMYNAYAIQYHSGDLSSGHYHTAIKNLDGCWYSFNDGNVSKINTDNLINKNVYMVFFNRIYIA